MNAWVPVRSRAKDRLDWKRFRLGLPALAACLVWVVFALLLATWKPARTEARYRLISAQALAKGDFEAARIACERLLQLSPGTRDETTFKLALCLTYLGRNQEVVALFSQLAPLNAPGYPPAQLYLAKATLAQTNLTPQLLKAAETRLLHAVGVDTNLLEAQALLGRIYMQSGDWAKARECLLKVVSKNVEVSLLLASVARAQGEETGAREWAEQAARHFAGLIKQDPTDQPAWRIGLADAQVLLKDYPAALTNLEAGLRKSGHKAYPPALGGVYAAWLRDVKQKSPKDVAAHLKLMQQGLRVAPQNVALLKELIELSHLTGPAAGTARTTLNELLAQAGDFPVLHYCLGSDAWERGAVDEARQHFATAFAQAPQLPYVANNMAMVLSLGDRPDYPRALAIIQPVVEKFPDNANFRDTRGQILLKLGRYQEALQDFEFALTQLPAQKEIHQGLAEACRHLGMKDLAEQHERLAKAENTVPSTGKTKSAPPK